MSTVEYDLDVSGGLMPQVQALIAPPTSEDGAKCKKSGKVSEHPYFKRPGKGHNHDCCDACNEGGDLICCDKCPASFHLTCHDPPLDETDIPVGQWLCHTCRKTAEEAKNDKQEPQTRNKRSNSSTSTQGGSTKPKKAKQSSLEVLVKAASMLNPKQFELPKNMSLPCVFPGTDKVENPCLSRNRRNSKLRSKPHELAPGGLVPLPARKCHECGKSCRTAPLLSCDYCPLLFHLDCLDPPLTALPAGRWMCPNHVEQFIDSKLVTSVSATERMKLWDRFSGPLDQDAIKTEFFRKVHCKNPPFRIKVKLSRRKRVQVPPMVLHHYKNPVPLLPSLKDVLRLENVINRTSENYDIVSNNYIQDNIDLEIINGQISTLNGQISDNAIQENQKSEDVVINGITKIKTEKINEEILNGACNGNIQKELKLPDVVSGIHADIERELKQLDDRLIKLLAYQRIQHLLTQNETSNQSLATLITNSVQNSKPFRHMPLPSELLTPADIDRISRVFTSPKKSKIRLRSKSQLRARAMLCPVVSKHFYNVRTSEVDPANVRHDASFMGFRPTVSARFPEAIAMRYRCMTIGRGSTNDIELERFGHCNFTSAKHAVIFYDECTKHYELMNYSEYGTQVNNVLYSCDFSEKVPTNNKKEEKAPPLLTNVRDIIDKKRKAQRSTKSNLDARMCAPDGNGDRSECQCGTAPYGATGELTAGWEGTAVLNHGSLIRFGCITFVFSIVDCASV